MKTTPPAPRPEYCGAFPGLSAAGTRMPCTPGECLNEHMCHALKRLDREAGLARARGKRQGPASYEAGP